jgi:putative hydrolase of HD superfamily
MPAGSQGDAVDRGVERSPFDHTLAEGTHDDPAGVDRDLRFLLEIDRLKLVLRQTTLADGSRRENSAEHSWHLVVAAAVLATRSPVPIDLERVLTMLAVHDIVEIDAGDTFAYDAAGNAGRADRERAAAERIFGLLPEERGAALRALWDEFEAQETNESHFAVALDRLQPLINNHATHGGTWRSHGVTRSQVIARMRPIEAALPSLWPRVMEMIEQNCDNGYIGRE